MHASIVRAGLVIAALAIAAPAFAKPAKKARAAKAARDNVITCTGGLARDVSHDDVVRAFGANNVAYRSLHVPGVDDDIKGTVIFPNRRARQIEIQWHDQKNRRRPYIVTFGPAWRSAEGVTVGATLEGVEKINGGPFTLAGFEWDNAGTVSKWNGGALAKQKGGCQLVVRFGITDDAPQGPALKVSGSKDFSSRDPNMQAVKPQVREIAIMYE
jgi:hypothetical protein